VDEGYPVAFPAVQVKAVEGKVAQATTGAPEFR
jgi:hypothetical protein